MTTQKKVMNKAWKIRKSAAIEMGCKVSEVCFSTCLKMAWAKVKAEGSSIEYTWHGYQSSRSWAARIHGKCHTFKLNREFVRVEKFNFSGSRKTFTCGIEIKEGEIFEIQEGPKEERVFVSCVNGAPYWMERRDVDAMFQ